MVNQKLLDYVAQQLKNGVSQAAISAALIGAGWSEADVKEALQKSFAPVTTATTGSLTATPVSVSTSPTQSTGPMVDGITNVSPVKSSVFGTTTTSAKPLSMSGSSGRGAMIGLVVCSVLVVALAVLSGYFYMQYAQANADLTAALGTGATSAASAQKMQQDLQTATADIATLKAQNTSLAMEVKALAPASAGTLPTAEVEVSLTGTLAQTATGYTITTPSGIVFTVRNAKDVPVVGAFKDLIGKQVTIGGVHVPASVLVKVISVNGTVL